MAFSTFAYNTPLQRAIHGDPPSRVRIQKFQPIRNVRSCAGQRLVVFAVAIVDDRSVPEAHKDLHGFLYSDGSEEHDRGTPYTVRTGEDEGAIVMPVPAYLESRDGEKPLGVYCVYDSKHVPHYIGYSRNMVLAIKGHLNRMGPDQCAHVRAMVYGNRAMASRANLERGVHNWIQELPELQGRVPQGNADPALRAVWEGAAAATATAGGGSGADGPALAAPAPLDRRLMSPSELAAYEEKKIKLRKAMGEKMVEGPGVYGNKNDNSNAEGDGNDNDDLATRRLKLMKAMDRGDWSAVINAQTQETLAAAEAPAAAAGGDGDGAGGSGGSGELGEAGGPETGAPGSASATAAAAVGGDEVVAEPGGGGGGGAGIVSPFDAGGAARRVGAEQQQQKQQGILTVEAVQAALEEVRPYLLADGGDVEVVEVKDGVVYLRLQGACSSCPSQSATMKGGIERVIRQTFGGQVRDILQLDGPADTAATTERVDAALNMLRGAISNLGGSAEVVSVEGGVCTLRYRGPPAIGKGVQGAIRDTFSDIREVRLVD